MNAWDTRLLAPSSPALATIERVRELFAQQRATWDGFRNGEATLGVMRSKSLLIGNQRVLVQANPGRSISTNAMVDALSVKSRPCFLCPDSLPAPERGVSFGDYVILPNPFPILRHHVTIAFPEHQPQHIDGRVGDLLAVARALGPEMFALYNGPRCGASAPDHMHFQACSADGVPIFDQLPFDHGREGVASLTIGDRNLVACSFAAAGEVRERIEAALDDLRKIVGGSGEPMVNIVTRHHHDRYIACLFPRARHRSACYYAEPPQRISVSPAAMEMAGVVVVADTAHFDRVDEAVVQSIYREVTLDDPSFARLAEAVG